MVKKQDLANNFRECVEGGLSEEQNRRYRNAIELYYKALVALCDMLILDVEGEIPDYHKKRDEVLSKMNGDVNNIRIGLHTLYRKSYYKTDFTIQDCKEVKNGIKTIIALKGLEKEFKESIKRL